MPLSLIYQLAIKKQVESHLRSFLTLTLDAA
jgi:hypothetical protein